MKNEFISVERFCLPVPENDIEGILDLSVSCNDVLYLIVTNTRLGNVLYKWEWPTITDFTKELKVTNANPPLIGSESQLLFYNDKRNMLLVNLDKSSKGQGPDTSADNSQTLSPSDFPTVPQTIAGTADTATSLAAYFDVSAAPEAAPEPEQPGTCSRRAGNLPNAVNKMHMKKYRFKISSFCTHKYYRYREVAKLQLAPGESTRECAVECAFADQQATQCVAFVFNLARSSCSLLALAESKTPLSYYDVNYVCYERIHN
ncbi:hypothetical protein EB796_003797 [Bugula neritina]|uniref:Apple domain-containing protein n=1 Tax=Bugula neritina TaxID=10212 RepID=A0A7J7KI53_BUGNE|nr:hypothetical protein EB796_003797 [Bugula neritina]